MSGLLFYYSSLFLGFKKFLHFLLINKILYFCRVIPRENGVVKESAFFALFLVSELAHSPIGKRIKKEMLVFAFMLVSLHNIYSGASPLYFICFQGSASPTD